MSIAIDRDASRIWVLNVGDLKPYERETEFFITYAWNATRWNPDNLDTFVSSWAQREFDLSSADATTVSSVVANLTRFNARRKPELLNSTTYSLIHYREYVASLDSSLQYVKFFAVDRIMFWLRGTSSKQRRRRSTTSCRRPRSPRSSSSSTIRSWRVRI